MVYLLALLMLLSLSWAQTAKPPQRSARRLNSAWLPS